uniref:OrfD n=1 Tax=Staphylococcus aureus TaxID=1280 RepID=Q51952_STAAU|nr:OrfD [Staphylococcus aureus]prf//1305262D ORF D [Staphylococcus sp.]
MTKVCERHHSKKKTLSCFYNLVYLDIKRYLNIHQDIYLGERFLKRN